MRKMLRHEKIVKLLKKRALIFNCSYKTAWNNYLTYKEKDGLIFEEIESHL